jgi:hypothetical protein
VVRLNSATGYITPKAMLAGRQQEIHAGRDRKLAEAPKHGRCEMRINFHDGVLEMHCAYALRIDGMYSDRAIREVLEKNHPHACPPALERLPVEEPLIK